MECNVCTQTVLPIYMHRDYRRKSGYSDICEECFVRRSKERKRSDKSRYRQNQEYKDQYRRWRLQKHYGLTEEEFDQMLARQGNACGACGSDNPRWSKGWCVDHDHSCCEKTPTCGRCNRGILCMPCNMAVGIMKEKVDDILAVAAYLKAAQTG